MKALFELLRRPVVRGGARGIESEHVREVGEVGHLVSDQDHCLLEEEAPQTIREEASPNSGVHCAQRVVQQVNICVRVTGSRQCNPRSLAA